MVLIAMHQLSGLLKSEHTYEHTYNFIIKNISFKGNVHNTTTVVAFFIRFKVTFSFLFGKERVNN